MQKDLNAVKVELYGHHCNLPHMGRGGSGSNDFITSS